MDQQGRVFFSEEKKQKTFTRLGVGCGNPARLISKSFLVLFCKKELLPPLGVR
jgi:hypothetical protein